MYVSKGVGREEWMWRGLAIAMCLAMVGLVVMPAVGIGHFEYSWVWGAANAAYSAANGNYWFAIGDAVFAVASLATIATAGATTPLWVVVVAY